MENEIKHTKIGTFRTTDMPLVAFLRYKGYSVQEVVKLNDFKAEFVFENVDRELLNEFNIDKALVEPKMFSSIMRQQTQAARRVSKQ